MYIEGPDGEVIGEVQQKWHPLRRNYELFLGTKQVAYISGQFLAWEFLIQDEAGGTFLPPPPPGPSLSVLISVSLVASFR